MLNPTEIDPRHLPSLQAAVTKHRSKLDEHMVSKLYRLARTGLEVDEKKWINDPKVSLAKTANGSGTLAVTATDIDTGLFIVLSKAPEDKAATMMFGQKYCQEVRDGMRQNVTTKIW